MKEEINLEGGLLERTEKLLQEEKDEQAFIETMDLIAIREKDEELIEKLQEIPMFPLDSDFKICQVERFSEPITKKS